MSKRAKRWPQHVRKQLRSLQDQKWYVVPRSPHVIRSTRESCCPVAALARRLDPSHDRGSAWDGAALQLRMTYNTRNSIATAADDPKSGHRAELMELLGMLP